MTTDHEAVSVPVVRRADDSSASLSQRPITGIVIRHVATIAAAVVGLVGMSGAIPATALSGGLSHYTDKVGLHKTADNVDLSWGTPGRLAPNHKDEADRQVVMLSAGNHDSDTGEVVHEVAGACAAQTVYTPEVDDAEILNKAANKHSTGVFVSATGRNDDRMVVDAGEHVTAGEQRVIDRLEERIIAAGGDFSVKDQHSGFSVDAEKHNPDAEGIEAALPQALLGKHIVIGTQALSAALDCSLYRSN